MPEQEQEGQWYTNKELFEMMQNLLKMTRIIDMDILLIFGEARFFRLRVKGIILS